MSTQRWKWQVPPQKMRLWLEQFRGIPLYECNQHFHFAMASLLIAIMAMIYMINGGKLFIASICTLTPGLIIVRNGIVGISGKYRASIMTADGKFVAEGGGPLLETEEVRLRGPASLLLEQQQQQQGAGESALKNKIVPVHDL